jgi:aspartate aminotransferase
MTIEGAGVSRRIAALQGLTRPLLDFFTRSTWAQRAGTPGVADFVVGNPHEMPLPGFVDALRRQVEPRTPDWFAYTMSAPNAQHVVAASLSARRGGEPFDPSDIFMTSGAFAGLTVLLKTLLDPSDEVIFLSPPWFFYEALIVGEGGVPVRVRANPPNFDLDLAAIAEAITPRTRAIIVNSPNNPSGRIYPAATLTALADLLRRASERIGHTIYLLSDEAYSRIVFDGRSFPSPADFYPSSIIVYTYGKTLLTPGQRLGYLALPPGMPAPEREALRPAITLAQVVSGYAFPNALLQHAVADLDKLSIDVEQLQRKRDHLVAGLRNIGYELQMPEGTFYLLPRSPIADDIRFVEVLAERDVFVLPGAAVELPGFFRISLTATDEMIERALPLFAAAFESVAKRTGAASVGF